VTVGYRFAPEFPWPAQLEDAKAAVRFIRAHASTFHIDLDRIGVMGESAGGYLASMVAVTDPGDNLEGDGGSPGFSSRVQAAVTYFSAADFKLARTPLSQEMQEVVMQYYKKPLTEVLADFIGTPNPDPALLTRMSVVTYVDENDPPIQIFQGDADPFVSVAQAQRLDSILEKAKVPHELILVPGGGHGWTGELKDKTTVQMMAFFARMLQGKK
jgi:acetyl esterase/lipase